MKIIKKLGALKVSRKALRCYAFYRRNALVKSEEMLNLQKLVEFHTYESTGVLPKDVCSFTEFSKSNGYANGKWVAKLNQDMIFQDISQGIFGKSEFCKGATGWWFRSLLK